MINTTKGKFVAFHTKKTPLFQVTFEFYGWGTWIRTMEMPDSEFE